MIARLYRARKIMSRRILFSLLILLIALASLPGLWSAAAQDATDTPIIAPEATTEPSPTPLVAVYRTEPLAIVSGQQATLSVFGVNFTEQTTIRLVGVGLLEPQFVNAGALTAPLPSALAPGIYTIEVSDPVRGSINSPTSLIVNAAPLPTQEPQPQPTPQPGQPSLLTRNFSSNPAEVEPGGIVTLTFDVFNQGNRAAEGVSVSLDAGGSFVPANGQASAVLPNIPPGGSTSVNLAVLVTTTAEAGPANVPLTLAYRDFTGTNYTSEVLLSVMVVDDPQASQVTLARYRVNPNPVIPGEPVTLEVLITNTGSGTAAQALLRIAGEDSLLLPGAQGDSFPLGDLEPGESIGLELPLIASPEAEAGPQRQPFTIEYLSDDELVEVDGGITIHVARVLEQEPILMLDSYQTGQEVLEPGAQFTLSLMLRNVGAVAAENLVVTFGSVESSGGGQDAGGSGGGSSGGGATTNTTPSSTFAPLGTGGMIFVGDVAGDGGMVELEQEFIVNGGVESGIYGVPITLRYLLPDGTSAQDTLRASVLVSVPPQLQFEDQAPVMPEVNVGEPLPIALGVTNTEDSTVRLVSAAVEAENAEVLEGAETALAALPADDDITLSALVMPLAEGPVRVTLTLTYLDDLNAERTLVRTVETRAVQPPPPPEEVFIPEPTPIVPVEAEADGNVLGRLLRGLLGLGSD
jgi:uncharacterized repeat protein (TIGR01451 family)